MKTINAIVKVLTALATIAGAVYIIATYGDKIVAWAKQLLSSAPSAPVAAPAPAAAPAAEAAAEEAPAEDTVSEEDVAAAEEEAFVVETPVVAEESAPVADEADFEG